MINPFTPGFNRRPPVFLGRESVLAEVERGLTYAGKTSLQAPLMLVGSRGMGKTVLLNEVMEMASTKQWNVVSLHQFRTNMVEQLTQALSPTRKNIAETKIEVDSPKIMGFGMKTEIGIPAQSLESVLLKKTEKKPILVTIDEIHEYKKADLEEFAAILQRISPKNPALYIVGAGLPEVRNPKNRITFFERANWKNISTLKPLDALIVLYETITHAGKKIDVSVCEKLSEWCGYYPFALQTLGSHIWENAGKRTKITEDHVQQGIAEAAESLHTGIFMYRWPHYTDEERNYLYCVAQYLTLHNTTYVANSDIARLYGVATHQLSRVRLQLVHNGILQENEAKQLRFLLPIMKDWVLQECT